MKEIPFAPSQEQRANLVKLANYLDSLPADYDHFDMTTFLSGAWNGSTAPSSAKGDYLHSCGTVACAVGHGPAAGIKPVQGEKWADYADRAFLGDGPEGSDAFRYLFGGEWERIDNTPAGAAARIRRALDLGSVPDVDDLNPGSDMYDLDEALAGPTFIELGATYSAYLKEAKA